MSSLDVAPSQGAEFLAESEAEQSELPLEQEQEPEEAAGDSGDDVSKVAESVPRRENNKRVAPAPEQPKPAPKSTWKPIEFEIDGRTYRAETEQAAKSMLAKAVSLQKKAEAVERDKRAVEWERRMALENTEEWLTRLAQVNPEQARKVAYKLLEDEALYAQYKEMDAKDGGQRAEAFLYKRQLEKARQEAQFAEKQKQAENFQRQTEHEAKQLENQFLEAIEKHRFPRNTLAIKAMAQTALACENDGYKPSTDELARDSFQRIGEMIHDHYDEIGPKNILRGISKKHLEWIRQAMLEEATRSKTRRATQPMKKPQAQSRRGDGLGDGFSSNQEFEKYINKLKQGASLQVFGSVPGGKMR